MRILILNWRDIKNPTSGGAEVLTHEIAKRWVRDGHAVTQFSSYFQDAKKEEILEGVRLVREGKSDVRYLWVSVHFAAFKFYFNNRKNFDVVIDEIHGIPFFTPFYVNRKKVALICEVAGRIWDTNFPFPFNIIGKFVERNYFKFYKNVPFLTISDSTKKELLKFGVGNSKITVLPMGLTRPKKLPNFKKGENPTLIFVARLLKAKGIEDSIRSLNILKERYPKIMLWVIGRGEKSYESKIKKLVKHLRLEKNIKFFGFVSEAKKFELLQKAHILVVPSMKEGFGLTVPEAGLVGTPSVAYNVEGLRDIIRNSNGLLVNPKFEDLAKGAQKLLDDKIFYSKLHKGSLESAKKYDWDKTAKVGLEVLKI